MAKKNILVVEDNHAILDVITLILESEAFNVVGLNKGADFINHVNELNPDVIIMDIMLPDTDGRILLKHLRADVSIAHTPVLMISARYNATNYMLDEVAADDFMAKPFNIDELMDKIYALLKKSSH
ncbi:response regulator transcription factor [Pedobacter punctiformis]|uniref:Response regulator transcription factor n=1 Tax=Pedobacter punctiformis TaxID=3004097 RepID=A0ABT4L6S1_9SPHI|nr:response regulator transcription factor [Pedobacter sp. HCMS5-2]MCZ4243622.1 response regulator transcription factor [Pedobacter sp. HCMS5-2]